MIKRIFIVFLSIFIVACATDDPNRRAKTGAAIGALAGAVLGHQANGKNGRFVGAAVGALAGGAIGNYMDKQQKEFETALAEETQNNEIQIVRLNEETLKINLKSDVTFDVNSSSLKAGVIPSLGKVTEVLSKYEKTVVHVIGHTDSDGSDGYNQGLSVKRAASVGSFFSERALPPSRVVTVGRGESQPTASNNTAEGRQKNRRVEFIIKPIVEGHEQKAYETPLNTAG